MKQRKSKIMKKQKTKRKRPTFQRSRLPVYRPPILSHYVMQPTAPRFVNLNVLMHPRLDALGGGAFAQQGDDDDEFANLQFDFSPVKQLIY